MNLYYFNDLMFKSQISVVQQAVNTKGALILQ